MIYAKRLLTLLLVSVVFSCGKNDHSTYNPYHITPNYDEYHQQVIESLSATINMFTPLVRTMIENPDLLLFTSNSSADERGPCTDPSPTCPCHTITDTGGGFPKTMVLTFDDGTNMMDPQCTVGAGLPKTYRGSLEFIFTDDDSNGTIQSGDKITLSQVSGFSVDNYSFATSGDWNFDLLTGGIEGTFGSTAPNITVTNTATNATTFWDFSTIPNEDIEIDWGTPTVFTDPSQLLNLEYTIDKVFGSSRGIPVTCTPAGGGTPQNFCVGFDELKLQPEICGCFTDGDIFIRNSATQHSSGEGCGMTSSNRTRYEFEYKQDGTTDRTFCDEWHQIDPPSGARSLGQSVACQ